MKAKMPTAEEWREIKKGNRIIIDTLFMANYDFICMIARNYCRREIIRGNLWEDMAQECYLYFEKFKFNSAPAFIRSIRDICVYVRWGGERSFHQYRQGDTQILTILDEPATRNARHSDENLTFGETLQSDFDIVKEIEPPKSHSEEVKKIALKYLAPRQAEAFEYFYYTDMTAREVGAIMNININGAQSLKTGARNKLKQHRDEIRAELLAIGLNEAGQEIAEAI